MNDAVSPEKPSKRRGARDDDWSSSSSFSSRFPLSFFFLSSQSAQKRDLWWHYFFLSSSLLLNQRPKNARRVSSLSLSLFVKSTKVCVDWRVSPAWISPRKLPTPSSNCAARTSRPWRSSPCWKVWPGDGEKSTTPRCRRLCNTKKGRHIRNT